MRIALILLILSGCAGEPQPKQKEGQSTVAAAVPAVAKTTPRQSSMLMSVPSDPEALRKLEAMGYTVHEDHLHAPGVTACPKMGDDPVM